MKSTNELFLLIKSLTRNEKRYFKLYASDNSSGDDYDYLKLFDIIDKQIEYDEAKVIKQYAKKKNTPHFAAEKKHLYDLILRSLNKYHSSITKENELNEMLNSAQVLYKKGLYDQSEKLLSKLIVFAKKYELFSGIIKTSELRSELLSQIAESSSEMEQEYEKIKADTELALECLSIENKYNELFRTLIAKLRKNGEAIRDTSEDEVFKNLMQNPLLTNNSYAKTFKSKSIYLFINGVYNYISGNYQQAFNFTKQELEHLENKDFESLLENAVYTARIGNMCEICLRLRDFKNLDLYIDKLKSCTTKFPMEQSRLFYRYNDLILRYYTYKGDFDKAIAQYKNVIEPEIKLHEKNIHRSRIISMNYFTCYAYLGNGEIKNALVWVNKLLEEKSNYRSDLLSFARILNCLIQFEIGDADMQESAYRAAGYYIKKQNNKYKFEELFLKYFPVLYKEENKNKRLIKLKEFKDEILKINTLSNELVLLDYFDIISWLESKIRNVSFSEIVRNKIQ